MLRTESKTKLVWWPTPQDYNEAIQTPQACLLDNELKNGLPYTNALELPRSITGSFASVYRMNCEKKDYALRLFLSNIHDQNERYALISDFVQRDDLPYTVTFHFLREGIKIHGEWLPALKMDWLEGEQLDDYIVANLHNSEKLGALLEKFVKMMQELRRAGIAHGDLQHGNILVCNDELRLVDYDGMFVPAMKNFTASELGHRNYQHPDRAAQHFGPYLDNFSAWIIYASLRALQVDPRLMHQLGSGDDCLLFRQTDFLDPLHSAAFAAMEKHSDSSIRDLAQFIRLQLKSDLEKIPYLELPIAQSQEPGLQPIADSAPIVRDGARLVRGNLPDWLREENGEVLPHATTLHSKSKQDAKLLKPEQRAGWFKPGQAASLRQPSSSQSTSQPPTTQTQLNKQSATSNVGIGTSVHSAGTSTAVLPRELQMKSPRKVKWNLRSERMHPAVLLALMLLNPAVWMMFYFGINAYGIDSELQAKAKLVSVQVNSLEARPSKEGHSRINYTYTFDNQVYEGTELRPLDARTIDELSPNYYSVAVLPRNPYVHESLNAMPGTKRFADQCYACLCILINFVLVASILRTPLRDRRLAQWGAPLFAKIDALRIVKLGNTGSKLYKAHVSFYWAGKFREHTIHLTKSEYDALQLGSSEIILFDSAKNQVRFYRFARYHAVDRSTALNKIKWLKL